MPIRVEHWYKWPWDRCPAVYVSHTWPSSLSFRCERKKYHLGNHAVERGMDIPEWRNVWASELSK